MSTERTSARARVRWPTPAALGALAIVIRLPAFFASKHLHFDDGVYGVSIVDMRHGLAPYTGVFSAQGPLHFPLLYVGDLLAFRTVDGPRLTMVVAGAVATLAAWMSARRLGASGSIATVTGVLVATTGTMLWTTAPVTGDGLAVAFGALSIWAALAYRDDPSVPRAVLTGIAIGAAMAVKPLVFTFVLPVGWWLASRRRAEHVAVAIGAAGAVWLASALPWGLRRVWEQSVLYHTGPGPHYTPASQFRKLWSTLGTRDLLLIVAVALGLVAAIASRRKVVPNGRADTIVVAVWLGLAGFVLVFEKALFRNHLATIVLPFALLFALRPPPMRWLAVSLVVLVPWSVVHLHGILWPEDYHGDTARVVARLRALPPDARAMSDEPGLVWRAGLATPRLMNDTSIKRVDQHRLTTKMAVDAAADSRTCAVVVWSFRFRDRLPGFEQALPRNGYVLAASYSGRRRLWIRPSCRA